MALHCKQTSMHVLALAACCIVVEAMHKMMKEAGDIAYMQTQYHPHKLKKPQSSNLSSKVFVVHFNKNW